MAATDAIIVAVAGVLGTLLSPFVSTWLTLKSRRQDYDFTQRDKEAERSRDELRAAFVERRDCYIALHTAAREYLGAIRVKSHSLESSRSSSEVDNTLAETRREYRLRYGEAQMMVPDNILRLASRVNGVFAESYGMMKKIEEGTNREDEDPDAVRRLLDTAWEPLREMRAKMRGDLGVGPLRDENGDGGQSPLPVR